ncbi:hypothetical protein TPHA_0C01720 [Tetrapisispora phaffii CBS 4417]|uniref:Elongin-C n=1 Tax=Tetrapisispora phaffii (strain ATCC 24235 / CBS 4417 / NBRC 1672 / NRRL Y-8282 / UCD 70-5) TaxID=1071381 RepID=G8BRF2_TETPH|nr:hypothetical protein TPHA_0C01720 [Tetrapisispora phaffii CBS 4417]CCE62328.1 hypothetical protein TPHA_0C01720 [Tetrapisispora phaffii CBS 4417]
MDIITLVSKDNVEFEVPKEVIIISQTLKAMVDSPFIENSGKITLTNFDSPVLAVIVDYLNYNFKYKDEDPTKVDIPEFEIPTELSLELLLAADYLNI